MIRCAVRHAANSSVATFLYFQMRYTIMDTTATLLILACLALYSVQVNTAPLEEQLPDTTGKTMLNTPRTAYNVHKA